MAKGDWAPGTRIRLIVANVNFDDDGQVVHAGLGYEVVVPSGQVVHRSGFTWHQPGTGKAPRDPKHAEALQELMAALVAEAIEHEGVEGLAPALTSRSG